MQIRLDFKANYKAELLLEAEMTNKILQKFMLKQWYSGFLNTTRTNRVMSSKQSRHSNSCDFHLHIFLVLSLALP